MDFVSPARAIRWSQRTPRPARPAPETHAPAWQSVWAQVHDEAAHPQGDYASLALTQFQALMRPSAATGWTAFGTP